MAQGSGKIARNKISEKQLILPEACNCLVLTNICQEDIGFNDSMPRAVRNCPIRQHTVTPIAVGITRKQLIEEQRHGITDAMDC